MNKIMSEKLLKVLFVPTDLTKLEKQFWKIIFFQIWYIHNYLAVQIGQL